MKSFEIRFMVEMDLVEVQAIDEASSPLPWMQEDFLRYLRDGNCLGVVIEDDRKILGFLAYTINRRSLSLVKMAVRPDSRRIGIGSLLMACLMRRLEHHPFKQLVAMVREDNLDAHCFLRSMGWKATAVERDYHRDGSSGYRFEYSATVALEGPSSHTLTRMDRLQ